MAPLCSGIVSDLRGRRPYYLDDWAQGCTPRALAATVFIFFTNVCPAISFASYLADRTSNAVGVVEVLFSMGVGGLIFALFAGQPLVIVGVTGPVCIFLATLYDFSTLLHLDYLSWLFWVCAWTAVLHVTLAVCNACSLVRFVTRFSEDVFGLLICVIYAYEGASRLGKAFSNGSPADAALLSLVLGLATCYVACVVSGARSWIVWRSSIRNFIADYGPPLVIVAFSAAQYLPAFAGIALPTLVVPPVFGPSTPRSSWIPPLGSVPVWAVFGAILPALVLTALLFFDHNISSLLSQKREFGLRKPPAFNYDFALLGVSVLITGTLGIPPNYGLIPQAPLHVRSLATIREVREGSLKREVWVSVCETRVSAAGQSVLILLLLTPPLLGALSRIPLGVLAGQFLYLGIAGARGSGLVERTVFIGMDSSVADVRAGYAVDVPFASTAAFTAAQLACVAAIFLITLTPAGVVFPVLIVLLVPLRRRLFPALFSADVLAVLDPSELQPTSVLNAAGAEAVAIVSEEGSGINSGSSDVSGSFSLGESPMLQVESPTTPSPS